MSELKACPFCGNRNVVVDTCGSDEVLFVRCDVCHATGPAEDEDHLSETSIKWNARPIERVDSPPDLAASLRSAWALTACHPMARREIRITQYGSGHVSCQLSSEHGGLLLLATGYGATIEEAVPAAVEKAKERIREEGAS